MNASDARSNALLVEDDAISRAFLEEALIGLGWKVAAFGEARPALEQARLSSFALLIADRNLPDLPGEALLAALRRDVASPSGVAKALALTADTDPQCHAALLAAGFDAVATKPVALDELARQLEMLGFATTLAAPANFTSNPDSFADVPLWDDAVGLRAVGGNTNSLATLRGMLKRDLPAQRQHIEATIPGNPDAARAELHKLRAACGFTGAVRLAQATNTLDAILKTGGDAHAALAAFNAAAYAIETG